MDRTLLLIGLGLSLCLTTLSTTAAGVLRPAVDFPLPVDSYHDQQIPSLLRGIAVFDGDAFRKIEANLGDQGWGHGMPANG